MLIIFFNHYIILFPLKEKERIWKGNRQVGGDENITEWRQTESLKGKLISLEVWMKGSLHNFAQLCTNFLYWSHDPLQTILFPLTLILFPSISSIVCCRRWWYQFFFLPKSILCFCRGNCVAKSCANLCKFFSPFKSSN